MAGIVAFTLQMEQRIHFCTTNDKVGIAYASVGEGPPLVKTANWLSHFGIRLEQSNLASSGKDLLADLQKLTQERDFRERLQSSTEPTPV